jgi:sodium/potassium-transporting ATPase subunit alpha
MVAVIAITFGVVFFLINFAYGTDVISNVIFCIGILVANIPEGL